MATSSDIGGPVVQRFLDAWYKHPLSLCIVIIFLDISFVYLLINNKLLPENSVEIARITYLFSGSVLAAVFLILLFRKEALYNALDTLMYDMTHRIHILDETFKDLHLCINPHEEKLDRLCPALARHPITKDMRDQVLTFEFLNHCLKDCGIERKLGAETSLALSKFYYKEGQFQKAFEKLISIHSGDTVLHPGEVDFCKGMILHSLGRELESNSYFELARDKDHKHAKCWLCRNADNFDDGDVDNFIKEVRKCTKNLYDLEYCLYKLSTKYFEESRSSLHVELKKTKLLKAYNVVKAQLEMFDSWTAYYCMACIRTVCRQSDIKFDEKVISDHDLKESILHLLRESFSRKPPLVRFCLSDDDLHWLTHNYREDFNALIGDFYIKYSDRL